ncbi:putative proton pump-interactor [Rosa chinensis]|uniref:Putative proton pump-interactor n=1 Tax=Rosa chinensis TaxID=74649 RepID=A0A2P6QAQ8_ROSCH|nr:putative proton pump-interactor [Rosa chinensis]
MRNLRRLSLCRRISKSSALQIMLVAMVVCAHLRKSLMLGYIKGLQYIIQHESIPLSEEKKILKEIKQLENTRGEVIANAAVRAKIQESVVHMDKEALQDLVKLIGGDLDGGRKEQQAVRSKIQQLDDGIKAVDKQISSIWDELKIVTDKRDQAQQSSFTFRQQLDQQVKRLLLPKP